MTDEPDVVWEAPPTTARAARVDRQAVLRQVVSRPGAWARLGEWTIEATARQTASDVRCGRALKDHPPGTFEASVGLVPDKPGVHGVWVRFVPEDGPPPSTNGRKR